MYKVEIHQNGRAFSEEVFVDLEIAVRYCKLVLERGCKYDDGEGNMIHLDPKKEEIKLIKYFPEEVEW